jgi:rod shape-determining protein MreD
MKATAVILTVAIGVALQMGLARFTVGGRWAFDLVLVAVAYAALRWGPSAGVWAGTIGGLTQDALAGTVIGVGGLAKTIVGFGMGVIGSQFIVARPIAKMLLVAAATVLQQLIMAGLLNTIDLHWSGISWMAMLSQTLLNALAAFIAFQAAETLPGAVKRRPMRRSSFSTRKW